MQAYGQSKLACILFTQELARRLPSNVHTYAVDPGFVKTDLFRENPAMMSLPVISSLYKFSMNVAGKIMFRTAGQGAAPAVYCATNDQASQETGLYYGLVGVKFVQLCQILTCFLLIFTVTMVRKSCQSTPLTPFSPNSCGMCPVTLLDFHSLRTRQLSNLFTLE